MTKRKLILFLCFLLVIPTGYSLGIATSPGMVIDFEPNYEVTYEMALRGATKDVELYVSGPFSEYVTLSRDYILASDDDKTFYVELDFPEELEPAGHHLIWIGAREVVDEEGGIGTRIDIRTYITVNVFHEGKFIEAKFGEPQVDGSMVDFSISVSNFGTEDIDNLRARIDIYDLDDNLVDSVLTGTESLVFNEDINLKARLDTTRFNVGDYKAVATIFYDGNEKEVQNSFRVGTLRVNVVDFTKKFLKDSINKFDVTVESNWNKKIEDVFVEFLVRDERLKSALYDLEPFEKRNITMFFDTEDFEEGRYGAEAVVNYLDKKSIKIGEIEIVEESKLSPSGSNVYLILLIVGIAVVLVIFDVILFKRMRRRE